MGKDRQERKNEKSRRVESDRDPKNHFPGSTYLDTPKEAEREQRQR
ncbi:YpzI family protein [Bacillaceae bacterium S4-13-58]